MVVGNSHAKSDHIDVRKHREQYEYQSNRAARHHAGCRRREGDSNERMGQRGRQWDQRRYSRSSSSTAATLSTAQLVSAPAILPT